MFISDTEVWREPPTCKSLPHGICLPLPRTPRPSPPTLPFPHNLNMVGTRITQQDLRKEQRFIYKPETKLVISFQYFDSIYILIISYYYKIKPVYLYCLK